MKSLFDRLKSLFKKQRDEDFSGQDFITHNINALSDKLELAIFSQELFIKALTHRSYIDLYPEFNKTNERLEFLGDAVLDLAVSEFLFKKYPDKDEGYLTKTRSHLVDKAALAEAADRMDLKQFIFYNKKFLKGSEGGINTIKADACEALIGAIYFDQGLEASKSFVHKWIIVPGLKSGNIYQDKNFKGQLLEYTHSHKIENPVYRLLKEEGPQHNKIFTVEVLIHGQAMGSGEGKNKKSAEQLAAKAALIKLNSLQTNTK